MSQLSEKVLHRAKVDTAEELASLFDVRKGFFGEGSWFDPAALAELDRSIRAHLDKLLKLYPVTAETVGASRDG